MELCGQQSVDINLCSGAGGLALGLTRLGFGPFEFFDKDEWACQTLRHNLSDIAGSLNGRVFEGDLSQMDWLRHGPPVRLLAAGAPCQPFSLGGSHKGHRDDRNLFPTLMEAVRAVRPQAVFIENVRGLQRESLKPYLEYILSQLRYPDLAPLDHESWMEHDTRLRQHGTDPAVCAEYNVKWGLFNAADFGVAQIRYRLFLVATVVSLPSYEFPPPTHSKCALIRQQNSTSYWDDRELALPAQTRKPISGHNTSDDTLPWVTVRDRISTLPRPHPQEQGAFVNHWLISGARSYPGHTGSRLDWPSKTLKAGVHGVPGGENTIVCDDGSLRYYTLREMARLQTFPDEHYFTGSRSNVVRQIGNAVPCDLATAIAAPLRDLMGLEWRE